MRPIIGGYVPPGRVIGRDNFIKKMWNTLENQSMVLVSERRIGKTSVIRKMEKEPREGWYPIFLAIEGIRSPAEFISKISDAVSLNEEIKGKKIGDWELTELNNNWKQVLEALLDDIKDKFDERVVFLWDEFPLMVANIKDDLGEKVAMGLLDVLRAYRNSDSSGKIRMVYTGSIGLHLIVSELLGKGYRNDPTNDMVTYSLEGLELEYAQELARQGLQGLIEEDEIELHDPNSLDEVAQSIAAATDGIPFYINHTVVCLSEIKNPIKTTDVAGAIDSLISDPEDRVHFRHYVERIEIYYRFHEHAVDIAYSILSTLCQTDQPMTKEAIWKAVATQNESINRYLFQKTLSMLVKDHYLSYKNLGGEKIYQFKYNIVKKWLFNYSLSTTISSHQSLSTSDLLTQEQSNDEDAVVLSLREGGKLPFSLLSARTRILPNQLSTVLEILKQKNRITEQSRGGINEPFYSLTDDAS